MPHYRVAREWRDYIIAIDVVSCHTIRMVKAGVVDASRASKRRARGAGGPSNVLNAYELHSQSAQERLGARRTLITWCTQSHQTELSG